MKQFKARTLSTSALICTAMMLGAGIATPAYAQNAAAAEETPASDIVVTGARKRAEDVQTVPIAITVLTAKGLAERNISNFNDLGNATPGVFITSIAGGNTQNIYIRGLGPGNTATDLNVEANVGVFIDGIYQTSRNTLDMISVLDVAQIDIAKGPQSALFGRSTFAGAMAIATARPTRDFEGTLQATVGENKDYRIRGAINVPLGDMLSARVAGGYLTYDGYGKNAANPKDNLGGSEKYAASAALDFHPSDNFTARLSGFFTHSKSELTPETLLPFSSFNCGATNAAMNLPYLYCGTLTAQKVSSLTANAPETVAKTRQVSLEVNWKMDGVSVTSVTGFTGAENRAFNDYDGSSIGTLMGVCTLGAACNSNTGAPSFIPIPAPYTRLVRTNLLSTGIERVRTFSQEIRLQSDNKSPFQWIFGGNYFNSKIPLAAGGIGTDIAGLAANERFVQVSQVGTPATTGTGAYEGTANSFIVADSTKNQLIGSYSRASTETMSIFGSLGYRFGDLRVGAEGRYNIDRKRAQVFSVSNPTSQPGVNQSISGTSVPAAGTFPITGPLFAKTFSSFAPRFTVDYQATRDIFLYVTAAKGVRSGGFNTANAVSATGILASEVAYDEETNWTYEAGFKSNLFDRRLLLNASVFHVDWTNAQISSFTTNPTAINPTRIVRNAGNLKATGFEIQADLKVNDIFSLGGSTTYSDPKFQKGAYDGSQITQCRVGTTPATYTSAPGCPAIIAVNTGGSTQYIPTLEGKRPQRSVKLQWNAHGVINVPVNNTWKAMARVDVTYTGPSYSNLLNTTQFGKRTLTSARLGFDSDNYSISLWGNNIFDKKYVSNSINQPRAGAPFQFSVPEIYLGEGRRLGVTATAKF